MQLNRKLTSDSTGHYLYCGLTLLLSVTVKILIFLALFLGVNHSFSDPCNLETGLLIQRNSFSFFPPLLHPVPGEVKVTTTHCSFYLWQTVLNKVPTLAELPFALYFKRNDNRVNQPMPRGWLIFKLFRGNCPQPFRLHN